jgi:RNA methyltransferase, TrmH family
MLELINKSELKKICSLHQKKYRIEYGLFLVEGIKVVKEFLENNWQCESLIFRKDKTALSEEFENQICLTASNSDFEKLTEMKTPSEVIGVFKIKNSKNQEFNPSKKHIALYNINDPGNLGTIIRTADWFGIDSIICSSETVDCFNPKVVRASMGSLARINISYHDDLSNDIQIIHKKHKTPIYLADMQGESIYETQLEKNGIIVMGSESHGLKNFETKNYQKLNIPKSGKAESLNVSIALGIICSFWTK